jgi:anhydro-N-acetylmuramic acid kinase
VQNHEEERAEAPRLLLGISSGTSADGTDLALVRIRGCGPARVVSVLAGARTPLPPALQQRARAALGWSLAELAAAHRDFGQHFGRAAREFLDRCAVAPAQLAAAASHGQTVYHHDGNPRGGTLQIGALPLIALELGAPVVGDFRWGDLALGGQGAPISPYADWILHRRAAPALGILNLGGIANLTLLRGDQPPVATDCGPANGPLDALVQAETGAAFDQDGRLASDGCVLEEEALRLRADPFFTRPLPRSTGLERFGRDFARGLRARHPRARLEDLLATVADFAAWAVGESLRRSAAPAGIPLFLCGGGAANAALRGALARHLGDSALVRRYAELAPAGDLRGDGGLREAVAFALLGDAFLCGETVTWPATTGCRVPALLGLWCPPPDGSRAFRIS